MPGIPVKVCLSHDESRKGYINIKGDYDWEAIKREISISLGLASGNRIKYLILKDGDGEDISAHLTNANKFINLCVKVYREDAGMVFSAFLYETPKGNASSLDALFSYATSPSPNQSFHMACLTGDLALCRKLILSGVDVMAEDPHGMFAMHLASLGGHVEVLKWLISL